jgi:hypothetical protein
MKKLMLLAAAALAAVSTAALADGVSVRKDVDPAKSTPATMQLSKAVRLSDAELDKISAAGATVITTGNGVTAILNAGHKDILKFLNKNILCINCIPL